MLESNNIIVDVHISCGSMKLFISFVYGDPVTSHRHIVWDKLIDIGVQREDLWF